MKVIYTQNFAKTSTARISFKSATSVLGLLIAVANKYSCGYSFSANRLPKQDQDSHIYPDCTGTIMLSDGQHVEGLQEFINTFNIMAKY